MRRIALIPARGGSKRLPRKNVLDFLGAPVLHYPIKTALESGLFDDVIVSSEDEEILEIAQKSGATPLARGNALASDTASVKDVCLDVLDTLEEQNKLPEIFCCIYATAILITPQDLKNSYDILTNHMAPNCVMGVSAYPMHPLRAMEEHDGYLEQIWPAQTAKQSQQFPHYVASNGTIYWARTPRFRQNGDFYGPKLAAYEMPIERAVDIDTIEDFERAKAIAHAMKIAKKH